MWNGLFLKGVVHAKMCGKASLQLHLKTFNVTHEAAFDNYYLPELIVPMWMMINYQGPTFQKVKLQEIFLLFLADTLFGRKSAVIKLLSIMLYTYILQKQETFNWLVIRL